MKDGIHKTITLWHLLFISVAPLLAQIDPSVSDVITHARSDTTIRVVINTGGHDHLISAAVVEWLASDSSHSGELHILASAEVPILSSGVYAASDPFFDLDDRGLACIMTVTNSHIGAHPPDQRIRIRIGDPGKITAEHLDDVALRAVTRVASHHSALQKEKDRMTNSGSLVIKYVQDDPGSESPWTIVRDAMSGKQILEAVGILDDVYQSSYADGAIELEIDAYECCGGTKSFFEHYRIEPAADTAQLINRVLLMNELSRPRTYLSVAGQILVTDSMTLQLHIGHMIGLDTELTDDELRAWASGVSLIPNSSAWIVAIQEHWDDVWSTWAFVIGSPVLTPNVRGLFVSSNSSQPGLVAGWVKIDTQHK